MTTVTARSVDDIPSDDLDKLYQLYIIDCERSKVEPKLDEFNVWLVENGYLDD